ncbi:MAG: hypothetical protein EOM25_13980, partial [Deltaproteobacteria bacterium]|nr:hypothetical protein [Deltaproteobacteria bacterium]
MKTATQQSIRNNSFSAMKQMLWTGVAWKTSLTWGKALAVLAVFALFPMLLATDSFATNTIPGVNMDTSLR